MPFVHWVGFTGSPSAIEYNFCTIEAFHEAVFSRLLVVVVALGVVFQMQAGQPTSGDCLNSTRTPDTGARSGCRKAASAHTARLGDSSPEEWAF